MEDLIVVIPSYNSKPWIVKLVSKLLEQKLIYKIIVVDDNSPDGTGDLIKKEFKKEARVRLIVRKGKGGRGSAVTRGFKEGLKYKNAKYFIEMDSDFAHEPKNIPSLVKACSKFDLVIGSRYVRGGETLNYSFFRKIFSLFANSFARLLLAVKINDYTSGFRCYKREVLENINLDQIRSSGFIVLSEMAYETKKAGFSIGEVPIKVKYHKSYRSNLNFKEVIDAFVSIIKIRFF